jgi:hypothetical protein
MKIYLAGPMRGKPFFNFPEFDAGAKALRAAGHTVFNPAERDRSVDPKVGKNNPTGDIDVAIKEGFSLREALAADMKFICEEADAVALLPGWELSKGALAERATANALSLKVFLIYPQDQYALHSY